MLLEILKRTPPWVFVLFLFLLALGYVQSRDRTVRRSKVAILPVAMTMLSLYGVLSAFGATVSGLVCWFFGLAIAVAIGVKLGAPRGVIFSADTQSFFVPGSWFPLVLMMTIFFIRYGVGVVLARHLPVAGNPVFVGLVSLCYGLLSGAFLARVRVIWCAAKRCRQRDED